MTADRKLSEDAREGDPSEWSSRALTRRLADYLVNAYTDGRGYDPADLDDVEVTLRDGFDIVLGERLTPSTPIAFAPLGGSTATGWNRSPAPLSPLIISHPAACSRRPLGMPSPSATRWTACGLRWLLLT